jgi:hypothetical protein
MKNLLQTALVLLSLPALAETISLTEQTNRPSSVDVNMIKTRGAYLQEVQFSLNQVEAFTNAAHPEFKNLSEKNISFTNDLGVSSLPYKAFVVAGRPSEIQVVVDAGTGVDVDFVSAPSQKEVSRNSTQTPAWTFKATQSNELHRVEYLGKYRGQDLSRVIIVAGETDHARGMTRFYPNLKAQITSSMSLADAVKTEVAATYDYLIVTPAALMNGLTDFVTYKTSKGFKVKVVKVEDIGNDAKKLDAFFKSEFKANAFKYSLIVGTDSLVVNNRVNTSGSPQTPSDYPYYVMDAQDMIPDVQYGRIVASTSDEVARQVKKWIGYENHSSSAGDYLKMIGIASNEGSAPSDEQYITSIEADMKAGFKTTATHFAQNNATSRPDNINKTLGEGVGYMVYIGHGSGTSWPSVGTAYSTSDIKKLSNSKVLQPIIIDVACQNGTLRKGYFGETWMNATNSAGEGVGASMYYGGSVNVSWNPPAVMAQGMIKKAVASHLNKVGDVIFQGQIYLLENWTAKDEVQDNYEWYHLFGDASSPFHFN